MQKPLDFYQYISGRIATKDRPGGLSQYQLDVLRDPHPRKTVVWHRRAGKTLLSLVQLLKASQERVGVYWHVYPYKEEARKSIWLNPDMLFKIVPEDWIKGFNSTLLTITFKNGSVLSLEGADDPKALRGQGPKGAVFDEFQNTKREAWDTAAPILRQNKGWVMFIGTPAGKNHFYDFYNRGLSQKRKEWKSWYMPASTSGILTSDELQEEWETRISDEFYFQEYECQWTEGEGQVFKGVHNVLTAQEQAPIDTHLYVMGVDVAKHRDFTVCTVFDRANNMQVHQERFQKIDWPLQIETVADISRRYNNAIVMLDATGVGDAFYDTLSLKGVPVTPIKFTEPEKRMMVQKLAMWIQRGSLKLLPNAETIAELEDFTYKKSITGKYTYEAREGKHDDIVCSLMLAVRELNFVQEKIQQSDEPTRLQLHKQMVLSRLANPDEEYFENLAEWEKM